MADQKINALPTKTAPVTGDKCLMSGAAEEYLIDYDKLATAILNKLTSKTFTLDQGTKTLIAALNELNSKTNIVEKSSIPYGSKMTIDAKDNNHHYILFLARNTTGNGHGAFLLTGYGSGGSERYKIIQLDDGNAVSIEVSGTTYVVTPSITGNTVVSIIYLMESKRPTVSVS